MLIYANPDATATSATSIGNDRYTSTPVVRLTPTPAVPAALSTLCGGQGVTGLLRHGEARSRAADRAGAPDWLDEEVGCWAPDLS